MSLPSPYEHIAVPDRAKLMTRVDPADIAYLRRLYPMLVGLQDKLLANLFHSLVQHLKQLEQHEPIEPAWYVGSPAYLLLELAVARTNFTDTDVLKLELAELRAECAQLRGLTAGRATGTGCGDNVTGAASGVRPKVRRAKKQRPDTQGSTNQGSA